LIVNYLNFLIVQYLILVLRINYIMLILVINYLNYKLF
jgi:hypothetical protein